MTQPAIERFLEKINISSSGCWEWTGCITGRGYGQLKINGKMILIHRYIYEYYYGQICPDLVIHHECENKKCCNINHLKQISNKENILAGTAQSAINARKTHCKRGHEFTTRNTYLHTQGRSCRICRRENKRKYRQILLVIKESK